MTELEQQLTTALTALSEQYEAGTDGAASRAGRALCRSRCSGSKKRSRT